MYSALRNNCYILKTNENKRVKKGDNIIFYTDLLYVYILYIVLHYMFAGAWGLGLVLLYIYIVYISKQMMTCCGGLYAVMDRNACMKENREGWKDLWLLAFTDGDA